jgi:hypothetical protein
MKKLVLLPLILALFLYGCTPSVDDALITNGVSVGTSTGLSLVHDANVRHQIAIYLQAYAPGLRTITSNPTAAQIVQLIDTYTPQSIQQQYPQVVAFATPLITNAILNAIAAYGTSQATVIKIVNDVATGLEIGSAGQ